MMMILIHERTGERLKTLAHSLPRQGLTKEIQVINDTYLQIQRRYHRKNNSGLPSRYTTVISNVMSCPGTQAKCHQVSHTSFFEMRKKTSLVRRHRVSRSMKRTRLLVLSSRSSMFLTPRSEIENMRCAEPIFGLLTCLDGGYQHEHQQYYLFNQMKNVKQ